MSNPMKLIELGDWMHSYSSQSAAARELGISPQRLSGIVGAGVEGWYILERPDARELLRRKHKKEGR